MLMAFPLEIMGTPALDMADIVAQIVGCLTDFPTLTISNSA
jgi:hypothetical protein